MLLPEDVILVDEAATNGPAIFEATKGARGTITSTPSTAGRSVAVCPWLSERRSLAPTGRSFISRRMAAACIPSSALVDGAEKADVVIIVLKNDAYAILDLEMARVREREMTAKMKSMLDLGNPSLDWVSIATGLGVPATRAGTAEEFHQRFEAALAANGPRLIECQVAIPKEWFALEESIHRTR